MRDAVGLLLQEAAERYILPRFRNLRNSDITNKTSATNYVTIADREAETWITPRLRQIVDCPVIGEEATATDPSLLAHAGDRQVWTVDPLDGTANFVKGNDRFCVMVSLVASGVAQQSWIWLPLKEVLFYASAGDGAHRVVGGVAQSVRAQATSTSFDALVGGGNVLGLRDPHRSEVQARLRALPGRRFTGSSGVQGCLMVSGEDDYMLHTKCTPWDHAPVDLMCREAGCHVAMLDGEGRFNAAECGPLLIAANRQVWNHISQTVWRGGDVRTPVSEGAA